MSSGVACVLFTDLVGSTELMTQLGDARFDAVRTEHFACLRQALAAVGGTEVKTTGDGLLATFASASEGLAGAVAVQQTTDRQARRAGVPLSIRVGLAFGEVSWENDDVFGTPVVEAARLVAAARPGQILCTALVRMVAGSRVPAPVSDAGSLELKGLPDPVPVCEVAWESRSEPGALPLPPLLTGPGRIFVGRDDELERARRLWKEVSGDGGRQLFLLAGEPGIGKTRLATELARTVHPDGATVLAGRCDEDLGVPYQPFVEALRHYVTYAAPPRLGRYSGELARLVPEVRDRLPELPEPLRSDPESERYRLFDAVAGWLADASAESPVLLVLDDLQWAAKPTVLLLRHVLRSAEPMRLLVVVTYRDTDIGRGDPLTEFLADLRREGVGERVPLLGLDRAGVGAFLEAAAGHALPDDEDEELIRAVWEETEGNPFFVAEVLRNLTETGGLEERDGRWVLTAPVEELGIPEGVRDVVGRRLSRLPEGVDRILAVAAVAGLEFEPAVVASAGGCDDADLFAALEAAAAARLVVEVTGGVRFRFSHALVRATLYEEMSGPRRVALHRKTAEAIESLHGRNLDDYLPALAHHWARASAPSADVDRAVEYATLAGHRALAQLAHDEAAIYYAQALDLLGAAAPQGNDALRQDLLISLGEAQKRAGDPAHRDTLLAAAHLAQERGDADALARAALANTRGMMMVNFGFVDAERVEALEAALRAVGPDDTTTRAKLLATLALETVFAGASAEHVTLSDEALATARRVGDLATLAAVLIARFYTIYTPATLDERLANTAELVDLAEQIGDPMMRCRAAFVRCRCVLEAGDTETANRSVDIGEALARDLGQPPLMWLAAWNGAARLARDGRLAEAEAAVTAAREVGLAAAQADAPLFYAAQMTELLWEQQRLGELAETLWDTSERWVRIPVLKAWLALSYCALERDEEARELLATHGRDRFASLPFDLTWMVGMRTWGLVAAHLGDRERMATIYDLILPYADQVVVSASMLYGAASHQLGVLAAGLGRLDEADSHFRRAAGTHAAMTAPAWLARTHLEWAAALLRRGAGDDAKQAQRLVEEALDTAVELGLEPLTREARRLLGEVQP
jgi:class 3 adenylate cyclase